MPGPVHVPNMTVTGLELGDPHRQQLDRYFGLAAAALNNHADTIEMHQLILVPAATTHYDMALCHYARRIKAVRAQLRAGTASVQVFIGNAAGSAAVSWKTAAGTTLSATTTQLYDTAASAHEAAEGDWISIYCTAVSGAPAADRLAVTLITG